jgi:hypothetical protein
VLTAQLVLRIPLRALRAIDDRVDGVAGLVVEIEPADARLEHRGHLRRPAAHGRMGERRARAERETGHGGGGKENSNKNCIGL